jgi:hypothetical protein
VSVHHRRILDFASPCGHYLLTIEDDGKVAYAYLKEKESRAIVGDVWLYNRCRAPAIPEWTDRAKVPFANPQAYVRESAGMVERVRVADLLVDWEGAGTAVVAYIYLLGDLLAVVGVGDRPGCARCATASNRLARVLELED